jgi:hypothetical protein
MSNPPTALGRLTKEVPMSTLQKDAVTKTIRDDLKKMVAADEGDKSAVIGSIISCEGGFQVDALSAY